MRRNEGQETWHRLLEWDRGQAASERLAALILKVEGYKEIDPSHPLGGKDGLKDICLTYKGKKWIAAVFFPRGQQTFNIIKDKFKHDIEGIKKNNAKGLVFITNQELKLSERMDLSNLRKDVDLKIIHLESLNNILNSTMNYGIRMEFLDIDMTKEEQLAYFDSMSELKEKYSKIEKILNNNLEYSKKIYDTIKSENETRSIDEISKAENEFYERVWLDRHLMLMNNCYGKKNTIDDKILEEAQKSAEQLINKYGEDDVEPYSDFEWGMINGKLSALRWVLGCEWDMLDS